MDLLEDMLQWGPDVVILCLRGNDITASCQPRDIGLGILKLCQFVRARGVATVVVADICRRWVFRDPALTTDQFARIGSAIAKYVIRYFHVSSMVYVCDRDVHWLCDGVHLSSAGLEEFMTSLKLKLEKIMPSKD
ncbi:hypothetical protein DPMN_040609 [Dreissena polymorpha]|uniref:Uncharacterized protein n=1 Tax=Dreissena polymorpha TaxID=45954 RepID=A0A9D4CVM2_DREPO|nr:hypothetical protein DPMN_040587 [Dreissena polymorpha]KAH3734169.1 hypothetical protein DPMN_040609 [Dreissena polymorpha]